MRMSSPRGKPGDNKKRKKARAKRAEAPKFCRFERDGVFEVDYRDVSVISRYISAQGKITSRKRNGCTAFYQRQLTQAIKRARFLALLPYVGE
jgi:small subunit ribosomal protein S18